MILRKLNPNKAHGHYQISFRMLQICDKAICKPLSGTFPTKWKMANLVHIDKRNHKTECFTSSNFRKNI